MSAFRNIKVNTTKTDENGFRFSSVRIFESGKVSASAFPMYDKAQQKTRGFVCTSRHARELGLSGSLQIRARNEIIDIVVSKIRDFDGVRIIRIFSHNSVTRKFYCWEYRSDKLED